MLVVVVMVEWEMLKELEVVEEVEELLELGVFEVVE